jgi:molybdopterin synthase catalytic subunit
MTKLYIDIREDDIDPSFEIAALTASSVGAISLFLGTVRDSDGDLISLTLEHYEGMTERQIENIANQAINKWSLDGLRIIHRVGRLLPQDKIVMVAASSAHREASLEATHYVMDYLKTDAPFWKAEETKQGTSWVQARRSDDNAKDKWKS